MTQLAPMVIRFPLFVLEPFDGAAFGGLGVPYDMRCSHGRLARKG